jgi:urease beta subunit
MRERKKIFGAALAVLGVMVWAISATLRFAPDDHRDVSIVHFEGRSIGVIVGGASVVGGIILLATAV